MNRSNRMALLGSLWPLPAIADTRWAVIVSGA